MQEVRQNRPVVQETVLDDLDQRILHALQISPRAPWSALGPIVGADPVTLARRWQRLVESGVAYVTVYGSRPGSRGALIEIDCPPGDTLAVAEELAQDEEALTIDLTAGGRDVLVTLMAEDDQALSSWVLERTRSLSRIRSMRTHLVTDFVTDARSWRLRALSTSEVSAVQAVEPRAATRRARLDAAQVRKLMRELSQDGRASATHLAEHLGTSPRTVRDAITDLRSSGRLVIRVDVARAYTAWPVYGWYFLRVPVGVVGRVGQQLGRLDEVRLVVNTVGGCNIIMAVWLRTLNDVAHLEAILEEKLPGVVIADRSVVLRTYKHLGHLLDARGFATGAVVPVPSPV